VVVDVRIAEGTAGYRVATDADGGDGSDGVEDFVEEAFVDVWEEISDVQ
jgi:hypothetical protein